jgi:uncharacterized membrane protein
VRSGDGAGKPAWAGRTPDLEPALKILLDSAHFWGISYFILQPALRFSGPPIKFSPAPLLCVEPLHWDRKGAIMTTEASQTGISENAASGLAYVTIIPAIFFLILQPYNRNPTIRFHAWQSIFLAIAWVVVDVGLVVLGGVPGLGWSSFILSPLVSLGFFILWLIVIINAFNGKRFKVPVIGDLAEKQANS